MTFSVNGVINDHALSELIGNILTLTNLDTNLGGKWNLDTSKLDGIEEKEHQNNRQFYNGQSILT